MYKSIILAWCLSGVAYADTYTLTTDPQQELALRYVVEQYNLSPGVATVTKEEYVKQLLNGVVRNYLVQHRDSQTKDLDTRYNSATLSVKQQIDTLLGR